MRDHDVQGELADGFEPSPTPILGPDGLPERLPAVPLDDPPPRLCEQGPCRHYHHFAIQLDAATPIAGRMEKDASGQVQLVGDAEADPARLEDHHYCYPTTGVEFVLGSLPVLQCSRWAPVSPEEILDDVGRRVTWLGSTAGLVYKLKLDQWRARQRELADAEQKMIDEAAAEMQAAEEARAAREASAIHDANTLDLSPPPEPPAPPNESELCELACLGCGHRHLIADGTCAGCPCHYPNGLTTAGSVL